MFEVLCIVSERLVFKPQGQRYGPKWSFLGAAAGSAYDVMAA